ncbi:lamin tail domain-containing protein [Nannocystis bainbridge]|uniref:Lamin tail domain-containing protein n=1 Tax=Nannocystis bainbridge TaxID=2995303 RepID=A0ABT5DSK6_9BACT|nr:lamin tail domain-containing protein [Nannocystis bainbridge]MDC0716620.1 lamin tail domain-containing protein [Nannocystis bainbridge]
MSKLAPRLGVLVLLLPACTDDSSALTAATTAVLTTVGATQTTTSTTTGDPTTGEPTTAVTTDEPTTDVGTTTTSSTTDVSTDTTDGTTAAAESCKDGLQNGDETDIDCGGAACPACPDGDACVLDDDCAGHSCIDGSCGPVPATCDDELQNGDETDLDCGGPDCPACGESQACAVDLDCATQTCIDGICQAPTCSDDLTNGDETDVDCGGPECDPCGAALDCLIATDCQSGVCLDGQCAIPLCNDGAKNGDETDLDCGGKSCSPCADGLACKLDADCLKKDCEAGICVGPTCNDGVKNGGETGIDCGGPDCGPCMAGVGLVINEVDYDQPGSDNAEFIEILNTSGAPIDLGNHAVVLVNGATNTTYATINLAGSINPGQYLVLANANFAVPAPALKVTISNGIIQNGGSDPDGIALIDKTAKKLVDALSYDGPITAVNIAGIGVVSLVEGMALPASVIDDAAGAGSLVRLPNGKDSNNAASDWKFTKNITPAAANLP